MKNKWFEETFLQSLIEKSLNNIKYNNRVILSEKQVNICERYMNVKETFSNTYGGRLAYRGSFLTYDTENGYSSMVWKQGRYYFFSCCKIQTKEQKDKAKEIKKEIDKLEDTLDILYEDEENNISEIERIENIVDKLWNDYNETLNVK